MESPRMPMRRARRNRSILAGVAFVTLASNVAFSTTYTWNRSTNNNWDNAANWTGGIVPPQTPGVGDTTDLLFSGTVSLAGTASSQRQDYFVDSITLAADFWHGAQSTFSINTPSALLTGVTTAHLTIGAGGLTSEIGNGAGTYNVNLTRNAAVPLENALIILGADQTWTTNAPVPPPGGSAITFTLSRLLEGDKKLTKSGTGVLVFATNNNAGFTGTLELQQGSIRTGGLSGDPNGHFGTAVLVANNPEDFTITSSTVNGAGGERNFDNDLILAGGAGALVFGGSFTLNFSTESTWTLQTDKVIGTSIATTHSGNITGNFGFAKENGGMMILAGANDYTGVTTVTNGVLQPKTATALGTTAAGTVVEDGGALELTGQTIVGETLSIAGLGEGSVNTNNPAIEPNAGALRSRSGTNSWSGVVTVTAADTYLATDAGTSMDLSGGVVGDATATLRTGGAGNLSVKHFRLGGLSLDSGAKVRINPDGTADGRSNLGSLAIAEAQEVPAAQLDITNNAAVISNTTEAQVRDLIIAGRAGGSWTGNGITSSTAATNSAAAVGYVTAANVSVAPIFGTVDPADVLVRYVLNGDADLSGTVDIGDFALLAANFNQAGAWSKGDTNYDGLVDIGDFALLAANFNQSVTDLPRGTTVPEPATMLAIPAVLLLRRRR